MSEPKHLVAVVGAGPAGLYAANQLAANGLHVVLLNRDVKPGGLAEYGIYHDKYKMKEGLRKQFRKILANPAIDYFGNVLVGAQTNLSLDVLDALGFQATLVTVGAQGTKWLGLPGEFLCGVHHAKDLVYHFNKLPPFTERSFDIGKRVALIGVGNVMVDIAHWLIHDVQVEEVIALARRGPAETKFSKAEMGAVISNLDKKALEAEFERVAPVMETDGQDVEKAKSFYYTIKPEEGLSPSHTRFIIRFLSAPSAILDGGTGDVDGLEVDETTLVLREDGTTSAKPSGTKHVLDVDTVIFCIGDRVDETFGLPVRWNEYVKNPNPRFPIDGLSYEAYDPQTKAPLEGVFVAGWARKASEGQVGIARKDGENGARVLLEYVQRLPPVRHPEDVVERLEQRLRQSGKPLVTKLDWLRLEKIEKREAAQRGLAEFKFASNEEMFTALGVLMPARVRLLLPAETKEWERLRSQLWPACPCETHEREMEDILQDFSQAAVFVSPDPTGGLQGFLEISIRAFAEGCETKRVCYMDGVFVEAGARRKGIGKAIVEAGEAWARSKGCTELASDAELDDLNGQFIHKRLGYREVKRLVHFRKEL